MPVLTIEIGGRNVSRHALWSENAVEKARLRGDRRLNISAGHRREHRDLQRGERGPVATVAICECGRTGWNLQDSGRRNEVAFSAGGLSEFEEPQYCLQRHRGA